LDPLEINAGGWYLLPRDDAAWSSDTRYGWAVCEATTGKTLAGVTLDPVTGAIVARARDGHDDAATAAGEAVRRFAAAIGDANVAAPE
jgi:hypothetical protein